ncbi:Histidine kinase [Sphingobium herbicidovorans NBRC 16415]|jgi:signal transduction histidine kinase|uniref:Histidine kinase n=1 Tax=Sphingobium herbicidovorans (strain ATCC 700291 / DSM 11019 / CCUG 56400 / KCTC 2939 / LMG 18315 / NBRC 16415 / MH) TaxID=1219045 RepID=A0A086PB14_SPHHM|nr:histidine kinase [Sphingobium herbicidovorans]KFG90582.1 Histidine kinase [Sphingobium herbicidovorans NBRC 16415]
MSVHRIQPQPFFADKNRAFWNLQSAGWAGAFLLRGSSTIANGQPLSSLIPVMISTVTGYSVTLLIAVIFRFLQKQRPIVTWGASIVTVVVAAGLVAFIDAWVFSTQNRASETAGLQLFLGAFYLSITLLGAWSALYYAINFYLTVEEQADQLLRLENQASSAQLAMLRYQLNPHFLFNTLNSISTLVLLKQTDRANAMLSRLSSFLRYTLINEPTAQVTIEQEVETLKLYLEIEKMRFEDRLRPVFNIDPAVAQSRLPSLLLQPLVENAIKYAVTPKEEGAEISITAQPAGENVRVIVSDTGPGLNEGFMRPNTPLSEGTGVGLANIRDRLIQAFGERQSFETRSTPSGFSVQIEMPLNLDEPSKVAA